MKIRRKPTPPTRKMYDQYIDIGYSENLADLLKRLPQNVALEDIEISSNYEGNELRYKEPESDEAYLQRVENYQVKLKEWEAWYAENKHSYELALAERDKKRKREIATKKQKIEQDIAALQNKLKSLK